MIQIWSKAIAYYDPVNLKQHNHFCSLTLKTILFVNGVSKALTFTIDTSTMNVKIEQFTLTLNGITQNFAASLNPYQLHVLIYYTGNIQTTSTGIHTIYTQAVDGGDTSATAVQSTNSIIVNYACDTLGLSTTGSKFQFQDTSFTNNQSFTYYSGLSDVGQINFTSSVICTGFIGTQSTAYYIQNTFQANTTMNNSTSVFEKCKNSTMQDICFLWDPTNLQLQYFSNQKTNQTYFVEIYAKFVGIDNKGVQCISTTQKSLSIVLYTFYFVCKNTSFTYQLFINQQPDSLNSLDFYIDVNAQSAQQYSLKFNNSCSSTSLQCDGTNDCGPLHFFLSADSSDGNFQQAQKYLNSPQFIVSNDPLQHTFYFIIIQQENFDLELPLVYKLVVGLQTMKLQYPKLDPLHSYQLKLNFFGIKPNTAQLEVNYVIGMPNDAFRLPQYIIKPKYSRIENITIKQIEGPNIPSSDISLNSKNMSLQFLIQNLAFINTTATFKLTAFLNNIQKTGNSDLVISVNFIGSSVTTNSFLVDTTLPLQAQKSHKELLFNGFIPPLRNESLKDSINYSPAWIQQISQTGLVEIRFGKPLYLPFLQQANETLASGLNSLNFIDETNTFIFLQTKNGLQQLNWTVTNMTTTSLNIQLHFNNSLSVSADSKEYILVKFEDIDLFLLTNKKDYLFPNKSYASLSFIVPAQYPSTQIFALFQSISIVVYSSGGVVIVISLIIQIIAKNVIQAIWSYYSALQLILLICQDSNIQNSASVITFTNAIDDIINLSALEKQSIIDAMNLPTAFSQGFSNYETIALIAGPLAGIVLIILVVSKVWKAEAVQNIVRKIKLKIFWNFIIRYFQASYINFQFGSIIQVIRGNVLNQSISSIILTFQITVVLIMSIYLFRVDLVSLGKEDYKKKIGNMYRGLNTTQRQKVMFTLCFYIQRTLVIVVLATNANFGVQTMFIQSILLINAAFLYSIRPYLLECDRISEDLNTFALLIMQEFQLLLSPWVSDPISRFYFGIVYNCLIVLLFLINFLLVLRVMQKNITIKLKRAYVVFKRRQDEKLFQKWEIKDLERENKVVQELAEAQKRWEANYRSLKLQQQAQNLIQSQLDEISDLEANSDSHQTGNNITSVQSFERYACKVMNIESDLSVIDDIESQIIAQSLEKSHMKQVQMEDLSMNDENQLQVKTHPSNISGKTNQDGSIDEQTKHQNEYQMLQSQNERKLYLGSLNFINHLDQPKQILQIAQVSLSNEGESSQSANAMEGEEVVEVKYRKNKGDKQLIQHSSGQQQQYDSQQQLLSQNPNFQVLQLVDEQVSNDPHQIKHKQQLTNKQNISTLQQSRDQQQQKVPLPIQLQPHLNTVVESQKNGQASRVSHSTQYQQKLKNDLKNQSPVQQQKNQIYISSESDCQAQEVEVNKPELVSKALYGSEIENYNLNSQNRLTEFDQEFDSQLGFADITRRDKERTQTWLQQKERQARNKRLNAEAQLRILKEKEQKQQL